jgi:hypothetical protein
MALHIPIEESLNVIRFEIADNYNIRAGSFQKQFHRSGVYVIFTGPGHLGLVRPESAPTDNTVARKATGEE